MASQQFSKVSLGLAIVGCGQIVTHHLAAMASLQSKRSEDDEPIHQPIKLLALCDPSAERREIIAELPASRTLGSSKQSISQYSSLDELVADSAIMERIQIIFIAVPHDLHETLALRALSAASSGADKIVVMEKPLAPTRQACETLMEASLQLSQSSSIETPMLIVAEQSPYWQEVVLAKKLIHENAIGSIVSAASYYYESMRTNDTSGNVDESGGLGWRGSIARAGGGIAIDGGLHWIRPLREMVGRIEEVVAVTRANLQPELKMEGETLAHALFKIESTSALATARENNPLAQPLGAGPLVATFSCNMLATAPMAHDSCPYFRITGTQGEIIIHGDGLLKDIPGAGGLRLYNEQFPTGEEMFSSDRLGGFFHGFAGLWTEICRIYMDKDRQAAHETVVRAADDVRVALAMYRSAQSKQWERT